MKLPILCVVLCMLKTACSYHILCLQGVPTRSHYNLIKGIANALLDAGHKVAMVRVSLLVVLCVVSASHGYHILSIQGGISKSHYNLMVGINNILLKAGHKVTFITPYPEKEQTKNLHYIDASRALRHMNDINVTDHNSMGLELVKTFGRNISAAIIETPAVQHALIHTQFDAVFSEWFFSDLDAGYAAVQNVPRIMLCGTMLHPYIQHLVDIARTLPTTPVLMMPFLTPMNFFERVMNTMAYFGLAWVDYPLEKRSYERHFLPIAKARGVPLAPFYQARYNVSVVLVNSHPTYAPAHSLPPNVLEVGGYHVDDELPPLPKDLQETLDSSPQGVVYFCMGSNVQSSSLPEKTKRELVDVFRGLPQTVLWKFEDTLNDLPKNLHIRTWMPQTSILAHPNVKVFITHSGLLSTIEAVKFGVPLVTIPVFADQPINSISAIRSGYAIQVKFSPDMAGELKGALEEILANDTYYKRAKQMSRMFNRRLVDPKKLILHYVELAIESGGAAHLRLSHQLAWYELWMLDQIAFLLLVLYIVLRLIKVIVSVITKRKVKVKKQ